MAPRASCCLLWRVPRSKLNISRLSDCRFLHLAKFASSSGATRPWKVCINGSSANEKFTNAPRIKCFFGAWTDCFTRQGSVQLKQVYANGNSYPRHGIDLTLQKNLKHFFKKYFVQVFWKKRFHEFWVFWAWVLKDFPSDCLGIRETEISLFVFV